MAARRCSTCGINYPTMHGFQSCPVHGTPTFRIEELEVTEGWEYEAARLMEHSDGKDPADLETLDELIPLVQGTVTIDQEGNYFVHSWDVYDAVRGRLKPDDLIRVGQITFEVLEYIEDRREYWVRPFETKATDEGLAALCGS